MKEPMKPNDEDCCNSGCNPCIFDVYEKQLKIYKSFKENGETYNPTENGISQLEYNTFVIVDNIDLCNQHKLLLLKLNNSSKLKNRVVWNPGDHFLFKFVSKEVSCTRAYTPIKLKSDNRDCDFAILIKRYENGLVSKFLCDINVGDLTLWRGPYGNYSFNNDKVKRIIMVAQGTGIAPFYSIIQHILNDEDNLTSIILLYCSKNMDSILLRSDLYGFKSYWNFKYEVYLSDNNSTSGPTKYKEPIVFHKLQREDIIKYKPFSLKDQFMLCGSTGFIDYFKSILITENVVVNNIVTF